MIISTKHSDAVAAGCRIPALQARLALLNYNTVNAKIHFYPDPRDDSGTVPTDPPVVSIPLAATAGSVDSGLFQIQVTTPIEAQITGANATTGTTVTWARIDDGSGDWWSNASVSNEAGSGEIKINQTLLYNGAYARLTNAVFQG